MAKCTASRQATSPGNPSSAIKHIALPATLNKRRPYSLLTPLQCRRTSTSHYIAVTALQCMREEFGRLLTTKP